MNNDVRNRKSLSDIGWTEERVLQYEEIAVEDHSYVATRQERSRNETSWKLSLNAEGIQGPMNQRSDFKEAKQTCKRLYHEFSTITGSGNEPIPPDKSDKGAINSLKVLMNAVIDLKLLQDDDGNQAATCGQRGTEIRGHLHPGENSDYSFNCSRRVIFISRAGKLNLLAIDGRCKQYTYRAHVFSRTVCQRACPTLLSQLYSHLVTDFTH